MVIDIKATYALLFEQTNQLISHKCVCVVDLLVRTRRASRASWTRSSSTSAPKLIDWLVPHTHAARAHSINGAIIIALRRARPEITRARCPLS